MSQWVTRCDGGSDDLLAVELSRRARGEFERQPSQADVRIFASQALRWPPRGPVGDEFAEDSVVQSSRNKLFCMIEGPSDHP